MLVTLVNVLRLNIRDDWLLKTWLALEDFKTASLVRSILEVGVYGS